MDSQKAKYYSKVIKSSLKVFFEELLSYLYRDNCLICGCSKDTDVLCKTCAKTVQNFSGFAHTKFEGVEIFSACPYEGVIKTLIHKLKFKHKLGAARVLAKFLSEYFTSVLETKEDVEIFNNAVIVPVPTSKKNARLRGYNNVYEIAKEFSELENIPVSNKILQKTKDTKPQYKLSPKQRKINVQGCFEINKKALQKFKGKTIIILDDIYTTGATIEQAILAFKNEGVENLVCFTLSKTV